ncbi:ribonuclease Z [Gracilibacillus ureilyticus]|uniref:Ribonuclease Z n=1 Tax=Gracilibacillus ureilyticus TaxID=531814 RepID=A0A1H9LUR8_9BACI|nr:ribonuclease Z [Gracilibacillus ureilyticus]SER15191.1 ribonuclease Z [Gracilibacillus ureilyticus]
MQVVFLGTGAGLPSKSRNVTSVILDLLQENQSMWMFDCGEATQHQILHTNIKPRKVTKIFITHLHGDHIYGLPGFLSSRSFQGGSDPVTIYGPEGLEQFVRTCLTISQTHLSYSIKFVEISDGIIYEDDKFKVIAQSLDHGITSFGYRIVEKDLPGALLVEELKKQNIPPGPIYQQIKNNPTVTLPSGEVIDTSRFIGKSKQGKVVVIFGDTRFKETHYLLAENADLLIHEATFSGSQEELANEYYHSTTIQAAAIAKNAKAKKLILTHISARFQEQDYENLVKEAKSIFPNTEIAKDYTRFTV